MSSSPEFTWTEDYYPICELGISDVREAEPDEWVDVSDKVHEVELFAGRARFTDRFEPSIATVTFSNADGWADLFGSPEDVALQTLRPGRQIRIGIVGPWGDWGEENPQTTRWVFRGWVDQTTPQYNPVAHDVVVANCIDALGEAGSSTAPQGPLQGENETADARMDRVLDAVEWFAGKRLIDASTETVIGTQLGASAIDMLGQAAESAGGVIYGDTSGNVVYRDIGWQLYDGDTPPDFIIGNVDPGTPPTPFIPGYLDPTKGYVWWPDAPPITTPIIIEFDIDPGEGPILEGPDWGIGIWDGHVIWWNSGHVWDLGPVPSGCWAIFWDPTTGEVQLIPNCEDLDTLDDPAPETVSWRLVSHAVMAPTDGSGFAGGGYIDANVSPLPAPPPVGDGNGNPFRYDTRTWDGGAVLHNLGSAGVHDLTVSTGASSRSAINNTDLITWDMVGGPPDVAPFTWVVSCGTFAPSVLGDYVGGLNASLQMAGSNWNLDFQYEVSRDVSPGVETLASWTLRNRWRRNPGVLNSEMRVGVYVTATEYEDDLAALLEDSTYTNTIDVPTGAGNDATFDGDPVPYEVTGVTRSDQYFGDYDTGPPYPDYGPGMGPTVTSSTVFMRGMGPPVGTSGKWDPGPWAMALYRGAVDDDALAAVRRYYSAASLVTGLVDANALLVFVTVNAPTDVAADIAVTGTGLSFAQQLVVPKGAGEAQGAVWLAPLPDGTDTDIALQFSWGADPIDGISWSIYAVTNVNAVGALGGDVLGDGTGGSVNGPASILLDAIAAPHSGVFSHVGVQAPWDPDSGVAPGDGWTEEIDSAPAALGYLQSQARRLADSEFLNTADWADTQTGTVASTSACALACELTAGRGTFVNWAGTGDILIGGGGTAYTGAIRGVHAQEPDGTPVWSFTPEMV
jgi:hypothetical protein